MPSDLTPRVPAPPIAKNPVGLRFVALASDYDGTLASNGRVSEVTLQTLQRFRQSGRKLILVTGRVLADLESAFPHLDLFDCAIT